eukprot:m.53902 g.53902  ORF g.53902 m.53902 type:complete len:564 (-) comp11856_c0_seq1:39-1730(-)
MAYERDADLWTKICDVEKCSPILEFKSKVSSYFSSGNEHATKLRKGLTRLSKSHPFAALRSVTAYPEVKSPFRCIFLRLLQTRPHREHLLERLMSLGSPPPLAKDLHGERQDVSSLERFLNVAMTVLTDSDGREMPVVPGSYASTSASSFFYDLVRFTKTLMMFAYAEIAGQQAQPPEWLLQLQTRSDCASLVAWVRNRLEHLDTVRDGLLLPEMHLLATALQVRLRIHHVTDLAHPTLDLPAGAPAHWPLVEMVTEDGTWYHYLCNEHNHQLSQLPMLLSGARLTLKSDLTISPCITMQERQKYPEIASWDWLKLDKPNPLLHSLRSAQREDPWGFARLLLFSILSRPPLLAEFVRRLVHVRDMLDTPHGQRAVAALATRHTAPAAASLPLFLETAISTLTLTPTDGPAPAAAAATRVGGSGASGDWKRSRDEPTSPAGNQPRLVPVLFAVELSALEQTLLEALNFLVLYTAVAQMAEHTPVTASPHISLPAVELSERVDVISAAARATSLDLSVWSLKEDTPYLNHFPEETTGTFGVSMVYDNRVGFSLACGGCDECGHAV